MQHVTVGRWGNNLAIRLPGDLVRTIGLSEGESVVIEADKGDLVIRRAVPRFTLSELFAGRGAEEWRAAYANAFEWGPDIGREVV